MRNTQIMTVGGLLALILALVPVPASAADADRDGLTDERERALGTDPNKADTDGDGYLDGEELSNPLFTSPNATFRPSGVTKADPRVPDIFIEVDRMGKRTKTVRYWFFGWRESTITVEGEHDLDAGDMREMVARFKENGWNCFIVVDDVIPHEDKLTDSRWRALKTRWHDRAPYYWGLVAHEAGDDLARTGTLGIARDDHFAIFDGKVAVKLFQGQDLMHELGHCLIDSAHSNPKAAHLLDHPEEWNDGVHCPYNCVLNYAKNLGLTELLSQWWEFDFDHRCWKAVRGRWLD